MSDAIASAEPQDALAEQGFKRANNDRVWDWLNELASNTRSYTTIIATVLPFLRDDALAENLLKRGEGKRLTSLGHTLVRDAQSFAQRLNAINARHSGRSGSTKSPDELITGISISQDYLSYVDEFDRVVLPTVQELLEVFELGGLDTTSIRVMPDKSIIYDMFDPSRKPQ